jgi:hypothetical protein
MLSLTPKSLIFNAIKSKLKGTGINKIVAMFNIIDDTYNLMAQVENGKPIKFELTENELNKIKSMFILKLLEKVKKTEKEEIKNIIIQVCLSENQIKLFYETINSDVKLINL